MNPTRRTQPYRGGLGQPGASLSAMLAGKPLFLPNPQDLERLVGRRRRGGAALAHALLTGRPS